MNESADLLGQHIDEFRVMEFIGQGGMADVYLAYDTVLGRHVALKVLLPHISRDQRLAERFRREARNTARLNHPNIVHVYAARTMRDSRSFIAMEYVQEGNLDDRVYALKQQGLAFAPREALRLMRSVAEALAEAHRLDIVHRDLKPSNILLRGDGAPVLTDLGISISYSEARLTQTNAMIGTPEYMSPEQARGQPEIDGRSDIYSAGIVLYELLAGQRPFPKAPGWTAVYNHIHTPPTPLKKIRPGLSAETYGLVNTCLQKDPAKRYQTAPALTVALNKALAAETRLQSLKTPARSRRSLSLALLLPLLFIALFVVLVLVNRPSGLERAESIALAATQTPIPEDTVPVDSNTAVGTTALSERMTPTPIPVTSTPSVSTEVKTPVEENTSTPLPTGRATSNLPSQASPNDEELELYLSSTTEPGTTTPANAEGFGGTGAGLPLGFESFGRWDRGDEPYGSFTQSSTQSRSGSSAKLSYNFPTADNDYVVFMQQNAIPGRPNALQVWVYGDGSGNYLNAWVRDAEGQTWQVPLGRVQHSGWGQMSGVIQAGQKWPWQHISGPNNQQVDYPLLFRAFVLDDFGNDYRGEGVIYLDDLAALTLDTLPAAPVVESQSTPTPAPVIQITVARGDMGRILYTSGRTILTTDPDWNSPAEVGTYSSNTCAGLASTVTGQTFNLYRGTKCGVSNTIMTCQSPNGLHELVVNSLDENTITINVRAPGAEDTGIFIYQGQIDRGEGISWSPLSDGFLFIVGDTVNKGYASGGYDTLISTAYEPIFSQDGAYILYRKPIAPGINDIFVSDSDGTNRRNVTNAATIDKRCAAWLN